MFETLLALLPKVGSVVLALPEFLNLLNQAKATMTESDQATLQAAYALAMTGSDDANAELAALIAGLTAPK